ncbi:MAG: hypothetical protein OSA42_05220 [Porticoccaceae bacterium]|nr:hypothetical protein [Porticoccaceae bacterium]
MVRTCISKANLDAEKRPNNYAEEFDATQQSSSEILVEEDDFLFLLNNVLIDLPDKQKQVLVRRFGLMHFYCESLEQVGLTREGDRQLEMVSLHRLRVLIKLRAQLRDAAKP